MEIVNDTLMKEDTKDWKPILDSNFTKKIENISGVKEVHQMTSAKIFVPWEDDLPTHGCGRYMKCGCLNRMSSR